MNNDVMSAQEEQTAAALEWLKTLTEEEREVLKKILTYSSKLPSVPEKEGKN